MPSGLKTLIMGLCLAAACGLFRIPAALAEDYALVPSLRVEERYNDNILFDEEDSDPREDFITTFTPGLLLRRHAERVRTELYGQGSFIYYRNEENLNDTDQLYRVNLNHQATEHFSWDVSASYTIDNQTDRDIEVTGLVFNTVERHRQDYRLSGDLMVAERTSFNLSSGFAQEVFDEPSFWENWGADIALGLRHRPRIWPNSVLQAQVSYRHYRFDRDQTFATDYFDGTLETEVAETSTTDNAALTLGMASDITERLNMGVNGGVRYTYSKTESEVRQRIFFGEEVIDDGSSDDSSGDTLWGFVGSASLAYRGERSEITLGFSHDLQPASGSGDTVQRTSLNTAWWYRMTSEWRFSLTSSYYLNRSDVKDSAERDTDTATLTVTPLVRYAFSRDFYLQGQYRYTQVDDYVDKTVKHRHLAVLTLFIKHDLLD